MYLVRSGGSCWPLAAAPSDRGGVRFTPESCRALADLRVRFGPKAEVVGLFDHLFGSDDQR
jgi:hypothetical protein